MTTDSNPDNRAIADNIRRTVERTALRKVRKLVDALEDEETSRRRLEKRALVVAAVSVAAIAGWFVYGLVASDQKYERGQSVQVPDKVAVPKKD